MRKLAEEHNRRHFSANHPEDLSGGETLIKGLNGMDGFLDM